MLNQSHYRFGENSGTESTHPFLGAEDAPVSRLVGAEGQFLLRACVQETAGQASPNTALQWQYRRTPYQGVPGEWLDITTSSSVVRTGTTAVFNNNADCTQRLSGTGSFRSNNNGCTHDGSSGGAAMDIAANGNAETLIGCQLLGADVDMDDVIEFRVALAGGTPLDGYDQTPTLVVLPQTQELLSQADRGPGLLQSGERTTGARPPARLRFDFPMSAATRDDPATEFAAGFERFDEAGQEWILVGAITFTGGTIHPKTGLPREAWLALPEIRAGTRYRGFLSLPTVLNIGCIMSW